MPLLSLHWSVLIFIASICLLLSYLILADREVTVEMSYMPTKFNREFLNRSISLKRQWRVPLFWGGSPHLQTLLGGIIRYTNPLEYHREILYDKDGGSIHIDWYNDQDNIPSAIIVIVPGVGGCSQTTYVRNFIRFCIARNSRWCFVSLNHRGCNSSLTVGYSLKILCLTVSSRPNSQCMDAPKICVEL